MRRYIAAAVIGLMALAGPALADTVLTDVEHDVVTGNPTVELLVGEEQAVDVWVVATSGDGEVSGCNIGGSGNQLVLDVAADSAGVTVTPQVTITDCADGDDLSAGTITIAGAGPVDGAQVTFTINEASSFRTVCGGSNPGCTPNFVLPVITVNVLAPAELEGRDAPAIANAHLHASDDNSDCQAAQGTNKNKNNWHGQLISKVAHQFEGQTFTAAQESIVTDFVDQLCGR